MDLVRVAEELRSRRDELASELGEMTAVERDPHASVSFGKRIGEGTTEAVERLNRVGTARELGAILEDVDRALRKLEEGTYGICDRCGRLIPEARLEARPWSVLCVDCAAIRAAAARST
jgi:DnaK suppressor protein